MSEPFAICDARLSLDDVIAHVTHVGAGAVDVFIGVVRDHNQGKAVMHLEYSAYQSMAVLEMARIADELQRAFPGTRLATHHRIGKLAVGDIAVICAVSAPHRDEAFACCRRLIDELKARVPIWKREMGPDGTEWLGWTDARTIPAV
jgi:molybdopterin synthase catalytic subunit